MTVHLDVHPADDGERLAAFRNVHDVWSRGLPMHEHLQLRQASVQHNRAQWFVGCVDGEVVTSLGAYPLEFRYRGDVVAGLGIGAVHTRPADRRRGYAAQLVTEVEQQVRTATGAVISLLFSDIKPEYYARLGYIECPAWAAEFDPKGQTFDAAGYEAGNCSRVSPGDSLQVIRELYQSAHADVPLSFHRNDDYWDFLVRKSPASDIYLLGRADDPSGYVWVSVDDGTLLIRDAVTRDGNLRPALNAAAAIARERQLATVWGWLPALDHERNPVTTQPRPDEITMLKPLDDRIDIDADCIAAADFFHEIDHF